MKHGHSTLFYLVETLARVFFYMAQSRLLGRKVPFFLPRFKHKFECLFDIKQFHEVCKSEETFNMCFATAVYYIESAVAISNYIQYENTSTSNTFFSNLYLFMYTNKKPKL